VVRQYQEPPYPARRRAYENAIDDFMRFTGIMRPEEFRTVTRSHVIAWRDDLDRRELGSATLSLSGPIPVPQCPDGVGGNATPVNGVGPSPWVDL